MESNGLRAENGLLLLLIMLLQPALPRIATTTTAVTLQACLTINSTVQSDHAVDARQSRMYELSKNNSNNISSIRHLSPHRPTVPLLSTIQDLLLPMQRQQRRQQRRPPSCTVLLTQQTGLFLIAYHTLLCLTHPQPQQMQTAH